MGRFRRRVLAVTVLVALVAPLLLATGGSVLAKPPKPPGPPQRVMIVLFDQMVPSYADQFDMPNFRALRGSGSYFKDAYLGYMASETVIAHNVITSGLHPKNMGWVDEAYRDVDDLLGKGAGALHITGDLSQANYDTIVTAAGYPKLADYLHAKYPGTKFITVGEKAYAVETATAASGDIAVRLSGRSSSGLFDDCRTLLGGRYRGPAGKNVPSYINTPFCNRYWINSDGGNNYGTAAAFPSWMYTEDGNRFFPGTDNSAVNLGHWGGDVWVTDAAIAMMENEDWSGIFITLGAIDKAGHMWGAQDDAANFTGDCNDPDPVVRGANQTHVRCAAEIADAQLGRLMATVAEVDAAKGGETLVVLTADHGATYGQSFYGKTTAGAGDSNWYYAPNGVWDAGAFDTTTYHNPSPAIAPLTANPNLAFSYQSTAIENWLYDQSEDAMKTQAAAMLTVPGVIASYWKHGDHFHLYGTNAMTKSAKKWWNAHGQEIVNTMAAPNGPDVVGLLADNVSYGVYGDHGGATESVQRVPMVFWSSSLAASKKKGGGGPFQTADVMPTILKAMGIKLTAPVDGKARPLN